MNLTLKEWQEFAKRDDCLDKMVPSDLRGLVVIAEGNQDHDELRDFIMRGPDKPNPASSINVAECNQRFIDQLREMVVEA